MWTLYIGLDGFCLNVSSWGRGGRSEGGGLENVGVR